ncbi:MAG: transglycosylase SLT domain-containing protein [Nitrospinae bacterium]|nr:transglycosylase SLT domain-containing protein [Nitrospinota bacterium]
MGKGRFNGWAVTLASTFILASSPLYASTPELAGEEPLSAAALEPDYQDDLFPEPAVLRPNVNFWLDVYTKYDENQAILHDSVNLDIRYEVVDLDEAYPRASRRYAARQLTLRKRQIADALKRLARREGRCEGEGECRIAALFGNTPDARVYREASEQLRVQYGLKSRFKLGLITSGQYMPEMRRIFERYGVPLDLLALPHVESSFNVKAYSRVGAAGIWQFMRSTGKHYMKINGQTDERRDPLIATEGAAKFLRDNHEHLESWPLVVTSYNHGKNGMAHAKRIYGDDIAGIIKNYDGPAFGFASRNFYCEFLAARRIMQHPERYFGNIDFHSPLEFDVVRLQNHVRIRDLARFYDMKEIARLNPALHKNTLASQGLLPRGYTLRIPHGTAAGFAQVASYTPTPAELARAVPAPNPAPAGRKDYGAVAPGGEYVVDHGDSLYSIAMKYNTTVTALKELNDMGRRSRINPGQKLALPAEAASQIMPSARQPSTEAASPQPAASRPHAGVEPAPRDRPGDGKHSIGAEYAALFAYMSNRVATLIGWNSAPPPAPVAVAAAATAPPIQPAAVSRPVPGKDRFRVIKAEDGYGVISVLPEETLTHYADWAGVSTREIMRLNKWRRPALHLWRTVKIPMDKTDADTFERRRNDFHQSLYKDFFDSHNVKEVDDRVLHRGQTAWTIWNGQREVPLWLISLYNEGKQLDRLHAGEILRMPVIEKKSF